MKQLASISFNIQSSFLKLIFSSVEYSRSVVSDSLWTHESRHARPPCPSPSPGVHSDSCPSSQWCHPAISSSVVPFSSCPQSLPASESFPMGQLFSWGGQSTGVSALASFPPKKSRSLYYRSPIQDGKIETQSLVATKCHVPRKVARPRPVPGMPGSKDHHLLVRFSPISDCNVNQVI